MFDPRISAMIVLSSVIAAPAFWFADVVNGPEARTTPAMYQLASADSKATDRASTKDLMKTENWLVNPRNGSDFPVAGQ